MPGSTDVEFEFEVNEGEFVTMLAHAPSSGQFALLMKSNGERTLAAQMRGMFDFLAAILDDDDYEVIEQQLHEGMDVEVITDLVSWLIGEWADRPTQPRSVSPSSPRTTGRRSTARPRAAASTT